MFVYEIKELVDKYNSYVESFGSLESFPEINYQIKKFLKSLKMFLEDYQYGADSMIRFYELRSVANELFMLFDKTKKRLDEECQEAIDILDKLIEKNGDERDL